MSTSTSIIGFRDKNKRFVLFGTDSRSCEIEFGEVVRENIVKIWNICDGVVGTGSGDSSQMEAIIIIVAEKCVQKPLETVKEVAELLARMATDYVSSEIAAFPENTPSDFLVAGAKAGCCDMFKVCCDEKSLIKDDTGKVIYRYLAEEVETVVLGHGAELLKEKLVEMENYPIQASSALDAREVMKKAMHHAKEFDFCTDGNFRVVTFSDDGVMRCSTATPLDRSPASQYDDVWAEGEFSPYTPKHVFRRGYPEKVRTWLS